MSHGLRHASSIQIPFLPRHRRSTFGSGSRRQSFRWRSDQVHSRTGQRVIWLSFKLALPHVKRRVSAPLDAVIFWSKFSKPSNVDVGLTFQGLTGVKRGFEGSDYSDFKWYGLSELLTFTWLWCAIIMVLNCSPQP